MFTEVSSVPVLVSDAKKAAAWYRDTLGFEVSVEGHVAPAKRAIFKDPNGNEFWMQIH